MNTAVSHKKLQILALMVLILLGGTAVRVIGVNSISPPGIEHDEVANWLINRSILDEGNLAIYFTRAYGHEAVFHYIQALSVALIGDSPFALRLPAVFAGVLGIAITFALTKKLFDEKVALLAAGLLAIMFWSVFYSRLGLRAIWLPVFSGLSFCFFWKGWVDEDRRRGVAFFAAGIFAGLGFNTYMAGRALPIFYGLFVVYLAIFHWAQFKRAWRGIFLFSIVLGLICLPLLLFLQNNPGAEFRVAEVAAPLGALRNGNIQPILENGFKILGMFGISGDPLWRQNIAEQPVFEPILAIIFYGSVFYVLWRWRDARFAFLLLWLGTAVIPSLVTIDAPSSIRIINALVVITIFPAVLIHKLIELSTVFPQLSTKNRKFLLTFIIFTFSLLYLGRTGRDIFFVWPQRDEIPFVWQSAFRDIAQLLDESELKSVSLAGWSAETMDSPSMTLLRQNDEILISHFNPQDGAIIIPLDNQIFRPTDLPLDSFWEAKFVEWDTIITTQDLFTNYVLRNMPTPQIPMSMQFGDELIFYGYDLVDDQLTTYWRVTAVPASARQLFIHFLDADGNQVGESYHFDRQDPQGLWFPHWQAGDLILQLHNPPANTTQVRLGWFDPYSCTSGVCQNLRTEDGLEFVLFEIGHEP